MREIRLRRWVFAVLLLLALLSPSCGRKTEGVTAGGEERGGEAAGEEESKGLIAFVKDWDIWVMDADGGNARNLTSTPRKEYNPAISPDGGRIAFTAEDEHRNVYLVGVDGSGLARLTRGTPGDNFAPAWSPDGKSIAFLSTRDHAGEAFPYAEVYLMDPEGNDQRRISRGDSPLENPLALWWLSGGREIAVWETGTGGGTGVSLVNVASGSVNRAERLLSLMEAKGYLGPCINCYVVNPARTNLVACSLYDIAAPPEDRTKDGLFLADLEAGTLTRIARTQVPTTCGWSAVGSSLYFTDQADGDRYGFFRASPQGENLGRLESLPEVPWQEELGYMGPYADFLLPR